MEPIFLSREQHVEQIMSFWRQKRIDEISKDVIYNEQLRAVAYAMAEPEPRQVDWTIVRDVVGALMFNFIGLAFGGFILWQMLRPL